jgi:hypothetical protein
MQKENDRRNEWFVPTFGPLKFRILTGLLFLPYTGMVVAFTLIGAAMAADFHPLRALILAFVYFLALGIGAHALDALGSRDVKPWSSHLGKRQLWAFVILTLLPSTVIGIYYAVTVAPLLWIIGLLEYFFLFAYNLEWFASRFHTNGWFIFSWGLLPVLAGYIVQTNQLSLPVLIVAAAAALFSLVEITASRPYKSLRRSPQDSPLAEQTAAVLENILKSISIGVILLGLGLFLWRWFSS